MEGIKQLLFMIGMTLVGTVGSLLNPFYGIAVYYLFAVLRPQYIWDWALKNYELPLLGRADEARFALIVGLSTIGAAVLHRLQILTVPALEHLPPRPTPFTTPHRWMLVFACWIAITTWRATDRSVAMPWFLEYLKIFVIFAVATLMLRTQN